MGDYRLTKTAEIDLSNIYEYGILKFGIKQAGKYLNELENCFYSLAENNNLGRSAFELAIGLRRFSYESHTIFYLPVDSGILVVRVLGQLMDLERYL